MNVNTSVQLPLERALKALIPYLQAFDEDQDPEGIWDFLDDPFPTGFLFMAGHEATKLPDDKTSFLAFIATLPDYRAIGPRYPQVAVKMELGTAGIADENTRDAATELHSQRSAALLRLFTMRYYNVLRDVLNGNNLMVDNRPWAGLGFDAWNAEKPDSGQSPTGKAFVSMPVYIFTVHFEVEPDQI